MDTGPLALRLRAALDLYEVGEQMQRQRLRRLHPELGAGEIEAEVRAWRRRRPGAERGDHPGSPSRRFG